MVIPRVSKHARVNRQATKTMIETVFGRNDLVLYHVTEVYDDFGQLVDRSVVATTFTGDLQFGLDLDQRYISTGVVEVGDAVLYISHDALTVLPKPSDLVVDTTTSSTWEIFSQIESPELGGAVTHYSYRCKRKIKSGDVSK